MANAPLSPTELGDARQLIRDVQDFRLQQVQQQTAGTFVGDDPGPALADPLANIDRSSPQFQNLIGVLTGRAGPGRPVQRAPSGPVSSPFSTPFSFRQATAAPAPAPSGGTSRPFGGTPFGGGAAPDLTGAAGGLGAVQTTLQDLFEGRKALVGQNIESLQSAGPRNIARLQSEVPELAAAARVSAGAFGQDIGDDFSQALQEAASVRGVDPAQLGTFNAGLAANTFLGSAAGLATQTGFEQLIQAGFAPPQNLNFGTIGSLNLRQAELSAQIQAGISQSQQSLGLFLQTLPGLLASGEQTRA